MTDTQNGISFNLVSVQSATSPMNLTCRNANVIYFCVFVNDKTLSMGEVQSKHDRWKYASC